MENIKRTQKQIERDCKRIQEAARTATSMKEIKEATGLSLTKINTTLSKHPIISKRIKQLLESNKKKTKLELQKQIDYEKNTGIIEEAESRIETTVEKQDQEINVVEQKEDKFLGFVIDASVLGMQQLTRTLSKICLTDAKIILTSITIKQLKKMQKYNNISGKDAKTILKLATEQPENCKVILIDETLDTPDECIIKYCVDNKERVTLLTSKQTMVLDARMHSVQVQYLKNKTGNTFTGEKIGTLSLAKRVGNKLLISILQTNTIFIRVYSEGIEYNNGIVELKLRDSVFVSVKKADYITFAHYQVISLYAENNCQLIYSKRIYDYNDINVSNHKYELFIEDFKAKNNS